MSAPAAADLSDLELPEGEEEAEQIAEAEAEARKAARKEALSALEDDALEAMEAEPDTYLDGVIAKELLNERFAEATDPASGEDEKAEELKAEAGEPVGPAEQQEWSIPPDQMIVRGTAQGSKHKWSGKAPGSTILSVKGVKVEVDGGFKKGERIRFSGEAVVVSEAAKDKLDKTTKTVSEAVQLHDAVVLDFELDE